MSLQLDTWGTHIPCYDIIDWLIEKGKTMIWATGTSETMSLYIKYIFVALPFTVLTGMNVVINKQVLIIIITGQQKQSEKDMRMKNSSRFSMWFQRPKGIRCTHNSKQHQ